jgi:hypothetical protein
MIRRQFLGSLSSVAVEVAMELSEGKTDMDESWSA